MNKLGIKKVYLAGSKKTVKRTVYTDGKKHFVKWYDNMVEVMNVYGTPNTTGGWKTVEAY